jgi:hypothetical protein
MEKEKTIDAFIPEHPAWQEALIVLKQVVSDAGLDKSIKRGFSVYS